MGGKTKGTLDVLYSFLSVREESIESADLVIGFGHFDPRIPRWCGDLWGAGAASRILFTGGVGAGTADLGKPEALVFWDELLRRHPDIPPQVILIEPDSRHTGENIEMTQALLRAVSPESCIETGIRHVILVATPPRQRRVWLACRKHWPHIRLTNAPPPSSLEADVALFATKGRDLGALVVGEMERILRYPGSGYTVEDNVPERVMAAFRKLQAISEVHRGPPAVGDSQ